MPVSINPSSGKSLGGTSISDKLLVWNSGHLPPDWTIDRLTEKHSSQPFNPDIANAFFRAGAIESWGRGIERIMSACRESGTPRPTIDYEPGGIWIKFPFSTAYFAKTSNGPNAKKSSGKSSGKTEDKIIAIARKSSGISIPQMAEIFGINTRAVEKQIRQLKQTNRLRRIGPAKGGNWHFVE